MKAGDLFSLTDHFLFRRFFSEDAPPWTWVTSIRKALESELFSANPKEYPDVPPGLVIEGEVFLHSSVKLGANAVIQGPAFIGMNTEVRPGAFIRGNVITGNNCVLGNSCEFKNCLLLDQVQAPHFNYVGDSVLGNRSHLGAGAICSNLRLDQNPVQVRTPEGIFDSGLKKLGALIGDRAEVGCNSVLNPGTILGRRSLVYPSIAFGGYLEENSIVGLKKQKLRIVRRD